MSIDSPNPFPSSLWTANPTPWQIVIRGFLRWLFLVIALAITCYAGKSVLQKHQNYRDAGNMKRMAPVAYTDPIKAAVAQKLEASKGVFHGSLLVIAVLWGLVMAKKEERKLLLTDIPELAMFLLANACFVGSCYYYSEYLDAMAYIHSIEAKYAEAADQTIMDFRSDLINNFYLIQQILWICGVVIAAMTLFSAHLLKEN